MQLSFIQVNIFFTYLIYVFQFLVSISSIGEDKIIRAEHTTNRYYEKHFAAFELK
jgi:hypothetical protein